MTPAQRQAAFVEKWGRRFIPVELTLGGEAETMARMAADLTALLAQARREALEECARIAETERSPFGAHGFSPETLTLARDIAARIRRLREG